MVSLMTTYSAKMHHKAFKTIIDKQSDTKKVLSAVKSVKCQVKRTGPPNSNVCQEARRR